MCRCYFLLLVEMGWNAVYFTGRWVELGQNGTNLLFTHSQLNISICKGAQGDKPTFYDATLRQVCGGALVGVPYVSRWPDSWSVAGISIRFLCTRTMCVKNEWANNYVCICALSQMAAVVLLTGVISSGQIFLSQEKVCCWSKNKVARHWF